jgi:beta-mannan synthase
VRGDDDPEVGTAAYPMVLVQIPMYNEREVIELSTTPLSTTVLYTLLSCCHAMASLLRGPWLVLALFGTIALQVYQLSIGAACGLSWPSDRIVIQVLDDSTDPVIKVTRTNSRSNDCTTPLCIRELINHVSKLSQSCIDPDFVYSI